MIIFKGAKSCFFFTVLRSDEGEPATEWANASRCHCCNNADVGSVGRESTDIKCGVCGDELEHLAGLHNCHIDDVANDHTIYLICRRSIPVQGG